MDELDLTGKSTLLVVDDMPDSLTLMSKLFKDVYRVKVANCGEKALKIASSDPPPDLILLDIIMPGMDGYEVCRQLKRDPKTMNIPVIFITAMVEEEDEKKGLDLGAIDYITKPISPSIVMARVKNHLALKAMVDFLRDQNDRDTAERLAYALKGLSGNIGFAGIQQLAEKLEVSIKADRLHEGDAGRLDGPVLIAQMARELEKEQHKSGTADVNPEKLKAVCDKLASLLANDDTGAFEVMDANAELLNAAFPSHCHEIDNHIRSFDFEAALVALSAATTTSL
jgi:response regulator RpfG family c-di-GMP phosphodiesterase